MQGNDIRDDKQIMPVTVDKLNLKYVRSDADQLDIHRNAHSPPYNVFGVQQLKRIQYKFLLLCWIQFNEWERGERIFVISSWRHG